jgi:hypothetical protein
MWLGLVGAGVVITLAACSQSAPPRGAGGSGGGDVSEPEGGSSGTGGAGGHADAGASNGAGPDSGGSAEPERDASGIDLGRPDGSAGRDTGADRSVGPPSPEGAFRHPGVLVTREQLAFIKAKIAGGADPWSKAFAQVKASSVGGLVYTPRPFQTVECGPYSNPSIGCGEESLDSRAAYTQALLWNLTGDEAYARNAVAIMNAWSAMFTGGHINSNAPLQASWYGSVFPRAAELMRATYPAWAASDIERFKQMLRTSYLPNIGKNVACANGNWEASAIEALVAISVFLDDRAGFDKGMAMWRRRTPAYLYLESDGALPVQPPNCPKTDAALISYWLNPGMFVDGLAQETCRDYGHMGGGVAALINAAETAYIQGVDLYGEQAKRIVAALEFNTQYLNGVPIPGSLCGGKLQLSAGSTWEIAYNHYANRLGMSLPQTKMAVERARPTGASAHKIWESLTHAELGTVGF